MTKKRTLRYFIAIVSALLLVTSAKAEPVKKLIVAIGQEPRTMDASLAAAGPDYPVVDNLTEYLIYRAPSGKLQPGLATSWNFSPDRKTIEFTLRKGVKFHSGDSLTTKDIEFSFARGKAKNPTVRSRLKTMERFEVIDDYHFKIHFLQPDVTFIPNRGAVAIVSKSYYDRVGEDKFEKEPVATSPYKFVRYVPGNYVDIERFEDYWGKKPPVKSARFLFVSEDMTRVAKLKAGEVDFISSVPYVSLKEINETPGLKTIRFSANHPTYSIIFANRNPNVPWHDKRVRLAMANAIDCNTIIKNLLYGIPNHYAYLAPYEIGYDPNLKPYDYDPKKARTLLAEAGYPKGFDLNYYWQITGSYPMARETAETIASYFEAVGIRTKLIGDEFMTGLTRRSSSKGPEAEFVGTSYHMLAGGTEPTYFLDLGFGKDGSFSVYYNPEFDKIVAKAKATLDDQIRGELIKKATKLLHDEVAVIPIYNYVAVYAMKNNIDFEPTQRYNHALILIKDFIIK